MTVSFKCTKRERDLVTAIADRLDISVDRKVAVQMDLIACHANGNPLDFERLLAADDFNLYHDVLGISNHIDRDTGQLMHCFSPRFSKKQHAFDVV